MSEKNRPVCQCEGFLVTVENRELAPNATHFASEWFEFGVEVAMTSLDSSARQGTLASPTTKVSTIGLAPCGEYTPRGQK